MKKVLLPPDIITLLVHQQNFLDRADMQIFTAESNEEALDIHREEKCNLIIGHFTTSGLSTERFCSMIREEKGLSHVSIILICSKINADKIICSQCKANSILIRPVDPGVLLEKAQELLTISSRAGFRILLNMRVNGIAVNTSFFGRSENISSSGILIETDQALEKGDKIACSFFLPSGTQIKTTAEVVRKDPAAPGRTARKYGLRFLRLTLPEKHALANFVRSKNCDSS